MHGPPDRDAVIVNKALSGDIFDANVAVEVICSRSPSQIHTIKQLYYSKFGKMLENDLRARTRGDFQKVFF